MDDSDVDIVFLSETWLTEDSPIISTIESDTNFKTYNFTRDYRGGGVTICVKKQMICHPYKFKLQLMSMEIIATTLHYKTDIIPNS